MVELSIKAKIGIKLTIGFLISILIGVIMTDFGFVNFMKMTVISIVVVMLWYLGPYLFFSGTYDIRKIRD